MKESLKFEADGRLWNLKYRFKVEADGRVGNLKKKV